MAKALWDSNSEEGISTRQKGLNWKLFPAPKITYIMHTPADVDADADVDAADESHFNTPLPFFKWGRG